ncbi:MAG: DUF1036 domain-containing protein [Hyphomicrobiales bacterium]
MPMFPSPANMASGCCCKVICLAAIVLAADTGTSLAQLRVCNQTHDLYNLSIGHDDAGKFETEGWWAIPANSCLSPIKRPLQSRYIYLYAANIYGESVLSGNSTMCVGRGKFTIRRNPGQPWNCWLRGYKEAHFVEIDTGNSTEWTTFIRNRK